MKPLSLQQLKETELDLLLRFDAFCTRHGIRYFLSNGTLLGAVRYGGFIPWDDDVDVLVPRADYDRLLALFEDDDTYRLFAPERNAAYRFPFAKLCNMHTRKTEPNYNNGLPLGVDMDIFPLDAWAQDPAAAKKEAARMGRIIFLLGLSKMRRADSASPLKRGVKTVAMGLCRLWGSRRYVKRLLALARRPGGASPLLGCKCWCIYGEREILPAEVFADAVPVSFEGHSLPAPVGFHAYLTSLYGDYMPEPPPEKRRTHHSFTATSLRPD